MKKALLFLFALVSASTASALDPNQRGTVSVVFDVAGLFFNQASVHFDARVGDTYSIDLGLTYGYGGRSAHPNGNYFEIDPGLKVFPAVTLTSDANGYMKVLGAVQFPLLGGAQYGFGGGLGYTHTFGALAFNPEVTSELLVGQQPTLDFRLNAGAALR